VNHSWHTQKKTLDFQEEEKVVDIDEEKKFELHPEIEPDLEALEVNEINEMIRALRVEEGGFGPIIQGMVVGDEPGVAVLQGGLEAPIYASEWHPLMNQRETRKINKIVSDYRSDYPDIWEVTPLRSRWINDKFYFRVFSLQQMRDILEERFREQRRAGKSFDIEISFNVLKSVIRKGKIQLNTVKHWDSSHKGIIYEKVHSDVSTWMMLDGPFLVSNLPEEEKIKSMFTVSYLRRHMCNFSKSNTQLLGITGLRIKTTQKRNGFAGSTAVVLPDFLAEKAKAHSLIPLNVPDNLCLWCCVVVSGGGKARS